MAAYLIIHKDSYHDSVLLMRLSRELKAVPGIDDAVVAMGTPANRSLLVECGYDLAALEKAAPNDLLIAFRGATISPEQVETLIDKLLAGDRSPGEGEQRPRSLEAALRASPQSNLALISVPGVYAAREARRALARGLHVLLFSDNVSVEDEIALKTEAHARGLLMMGPDCGTAIIGGKPLAFANVIRRGPIGIVGASGTGIQEISCCIHRLGGGITHAIGTGGRDLSDRVGGITTLMAIDALAAEEATKVLVVVSKPPSPAVAQRVIEALGRAGKPAVVHFVGTMPAEGDVRGVFHANSLAGAAEIACRCAGIEVDVQKHDSQAQSARSARLNPGAKLLGLFCGGTTGQEALALLSRAGFSIHSNLHKSGPLRIEGTQRVSGHVVLDLGDDAFTIGRPHPMIEPLLRNDRLEEEMRDDDVGLLLFDCLLGYGSHADPAGVLADGVTRAREIARRRGADVVAIASITGTELDPQDCREQKRKLEQAGVIVADSNRDAVLLAADIFARSGQEEPS